MEHKHYRLRALSHGQAQSVDDNETLFEITCLTIHVVLLWVMVEAIPLSEQSVACSIGSTENSSSIRGILDLVRIAHPLVVSCRLIRAGAARFLF
jgi:hypothetical protein